MNERPRWERCVSHRGAVAESFIHDYFGQRDRNPLLIAGAGFDSRSTRLAEMLTHCSGDRLSGVFFREDRPSPRPDLVTHASKNEVLLRTLVPSSTVHSFDVFDIDNAPVGGRRAVSLLHKHLSLDGTSDLVLDCSALSIGVLFPIAKYCYERVTQSPRLLNFHLIVLDNPAADGAVEDSPCGKASALHAFQGGLNTEGVTSAARLWLPQLGPGKHEVLKLVHQFVKPHAVCPILPFPASHPRAPDYLIEEYGDLFETISDPFQTTWHVDDRDVVYTHEKSPLDLYRTILRIDDARRGVFEQTGGSQIILSPVGSKAVAIGMLMASLERGFAVVSVETIAYKPSSSVLTPPSNGGEFVHIWLHGDAYPQAGDKEVTES